MDRKLSDEEINKIAQKVCEDLQTQLYVNVGSGIIALAVRGLVLVVLILAAYGIGHKIF